MLIYNFCMSGGCPYVTPACVACTGFCERVREAQRNFDNWNNKSTGDSHKEEKCKQRFTRVLLPFGMFYYCFQAKAFPILLEFYLRIWYITWEIVCCSKEIYLTFTTRQKIWMCIHFCTSNQQICTFTQ